VHVIIDYLISKDGLRLDQVDVSLSGIRLGRNRSGFVAQSAAEVTGTLRVTLADLSAAIARPEVVNQLLGGIPGIARPEITFANGDDGGIRIVGSVEALGRRIPITTSTRIRIGKNRFIVSPVRLEGLPLLGAFPLQLPDLELPVNLPLGLAFTDVTTEPGCIVLTFGGSDVRFIPADPDAVSDPTPGPRPGRAVEPPEDAA
jgi:LmeA-like phospholipid-binding